MEIYIIFGILTLTYVMVVTKRVRGLITGFQFQSFFLFLLTAVEAWSGRSIELGTVAALLLLVKVIGIPQLLSRMTDRVRASEDLGLILNSQLSLVSGLLLTYLSWLFYSYVVRGHNLTEGIALSASLSIILMGLFLMIFRMKALSQIVGLLTMENGIFLLASSLSGGMPFIVEIAIFFDVLMSVIILGMFVYRINKLFTHVDVSRMTHLRG
ncbi:MAG TPA: hypothetical protein VMD02_04650 [Candidatus Omnitrophota bacterium]|nr:hypothetical protein [Candidatus Omnitrophota bacterium]